MGPIFKGEEPNIFFGFLTLEDENDRFTGNLAKKLPLLAT